MARGRKLKRGGAKAKPEAQAADAKVEQEGADTPKTAVKELGERQTRGTSDVQGSGAKSKVAKEKGRRGKKPLRNRRKGDLSKKGGDKEVVDFAGLIFMCNSVTKKDCFKYHVFGFPEARKDVIERAKKGIKLFLFDIDQKVLYGVYKASSLGGMNLVSEAFQDSERKFPAQVLS